ncbi:uncharacterized protein LOC126741036 [Anthonomus grandis grandis]|uniref:uncharacterized protein LOC126741036 n=1 Tax=Anthonomus grandis grandis TaxID=2921223 RepID=UPI0021660761|nr:uncharacterized protein LOC126741036 [Anthonomus grandis grandis]
MICKVMEMQFCFISPKVLKVKNGQCLKNEEFVLIIMTAAQCEMLKIYGTDCICIDGTHGMNNYDFELITLLVVDDIRQGFPCSFLVSNRSDKQVLKIFFHFVKSRLGTALCPNVFMLDMAEAFFNAWIEIMSPPKFRLYCSWHVDQAWRKNLSKINTKEKQAFIYKNLKAVLEERDVTTFNILINKLYTMLLEDPDTMEFANYFNKYYMCCVECWAHCHRLGAGLNTNMHLERMHKILKYTYLKGKKVKRLGKAINAIMRFVRDKCIDRLIVLNKGKLSSKLQIIRSRHKQSLKLREDLVVECENGWNIASETTDCKCQLLCNECKTCIHQFCCSCLDSSVKYNMCKHIHLLIRYIFQCVTDSLEHPQELGK